MSALLWIAVVVTSLAYPKQHVGLHFSLPYETRFTCEAALKLVDLQSIMDTAEKRFDAQHRHITVRRAFVECRTASSLL